MKPTLSPPRLSSLSPTHDQFLHTALHTSSIISSNMCFEYQAAYLIYRPRFHFPRYLFFLILTATISKFFIGFRIWLIFACQLISDLCWYSAIYRLVIDLSQASILADKLVQELQCRIFIIKSNYVWISNYKSKLSILLIYKREWTLELKAQ